ncbi:hypothetical protein Fmac_021843 [Flemingia macrophylla]|uniref:Late embryogenesis abundant protein LEA-2 subgroup domain-containing protein n=1 Tax=Flemingia macrophylla TaxID=520843 RepID=A0ABD1LY49_9FABA
MPPTNSSNNNNTCHNNSCVRNFILVLIIIFVIAMAIINIAWLVMHPRYPGFRVTSLSVTNFIVSDSQVRGRYEVVLNVTNPNNKIITEVGFHSVAMLVLYGQEWHAVAAVQQVFMEKLTNKSVKVGLEVRNPHEKAVPEALVKNWNKGVVNLNLVLSVKVTFEAGILPSEDKLLDVCCMDLDVEFPSSTKGTGKLLGMGKNCTTRNMERA